MGLIKGILITFFLFLLIFPKVVLAQVESNESFEAKVIRIAKEDQIDFNGKLQPYQKLELVIESGNKKGQLISIENGNVLLVNQILYQVGDEVAVISQKNPDGEVRYFISDFIRRDSLYFLSAIFLGVTLLVARWSGFKSLLGMAFSFLLIFKLILPQLIAGNDPIFVIALSSIFIIPVTFYLSHGFNKKTTISIIATFIALMLTAALAGFFVSNARLSGYASEEAGFLQAAKGGAINIKGLLLAGIIIGAMGILNDITISQASVVEQLKKTAGDISFAKLYKSTMNVGQDHIASMVNTLVLVYTGSALPLLLLFINNPHPFSEVINYEIVAEEIVKTLLASSALILAVPLTTLIACLVYTKQSN